MYSRLCFGFEHVIPLVKVHLTHDYKALGRHLKLSIKGSTISYYDSLNLHVCNFLHIEIQRYVLRLPHCIHIKYMLKYIKQMYVYNIIYLLYVYWYTLWVQVLQKMKLKQARVIKSLKHSYVIILYTYYGLEKKR